MQPNQFVGWMTLYPSTNHTAMVEEKSVFHPTELCHD
jgi:hypothetical protein